MLIWSVKLRVTLICIPRSLTHCVCSIVVSFGLQYDADSLMCWFLPYLRSSNLFELNCMLFVSCHLYIVFRSFCSVLTSSSSVIGRRTLVSSAKEETWLLVFSFMSPIRMRNSIGPKTVPWGNLLITWDIVEAAPFADILGSVTESHFPTNTKCFQFVA